MSAYLLVALGSAIGGVARYGVYQLMARWLGTQFPWGTLAVNLAGSALIGWLAATLPPAAAPWRLLLMTGVCGGFTTFSAFSMDTLQLLRAGEPGRAALNVAGSVLSCGLAVAAANRWGRT
jgi:CrcB protein